MTPVKAHTLAAGLVAAIALYSLLWLSLSLFSLQDSAAVPRYVNDSVVSKVNITNFAPRLYDIIVDDVTPSPANEITLTTGTTRRVWCNATVVDKNGRDDLVAVNATLYHVTGTWATADDKNVHYSNNSCAVMDTGAYNASYSCTFAVWYFANNGTWYCNMTAWDNGTTNLNGLSSSNSSTDATYINALYALNVPAVVNFGELVLGATSVNTFINVTNIGNMNIDLNLYAYGGTASPVGQPENNLSMICQLGNITVGNLRYDLTSDDDAWAGMTAVSGQLKNPSAVGAFSLAQRTSELTNRTKETYWKIKAPDFDAKGQCNGTIVFNAVRDT